MQFLVLVTKFLGLFLFLLFTSKSLDPVFVHSYGRFCSVHTPQTCSSNPEAFHDSENPPLSCWTKQYVALEFCHHTVPSTIGWTMPESGRFHEICIGPHMLYGLNFHTIRKSTSSNKPYIRLPQKVSYIQEFHYIYIVVCQEFEERNPPSFSIK